MTDRIQYDQFATGTIGASVRCRSIRRVTDRQVVDASDHLIAEEPLEIRLQWREKGQDHQRSLSMTMRTPGADRELVAGFLFAEGVISYWADIEDLSIRPLIGKFDGDRADVVLRHGLVPSRSQLERQALTNSSCGVCSKTTADDLRGVEAQSSWAGAESKVRASTLTTLPSLQRNSQNLFGLTGGVHATSLFDLDGRLIDTAEDVGRHNAFDKIVGRALMRGDIPLHDKIVVVSGRASFELVQKAASAGVPVLCAVGAPSSLAVETADAAAMTLIGFLKNDRLNIYTRAERIH